MLPQRNGREQARGQQQHQAWQPEGHEGEAEQHDEPRGRCDPDKGADDVEPGEERGLRLEEAVEGELRIAFRVGDDRHRGQMVGQVLQGRHVDERQRPRTEGQQRQADPDCQLSVRERPAKGLRMPVVPEPASSDRDVRSGRLRRQRRGVHV